VLAVVAGFVMTPFQDWLGPWLSDGAETEHANGTAIAVSIVVSLLGLGLGWLIYGGRGAVRPDVVSSRMPWLARLLERKYYVDELYDLLFVKSLDRLGHALRVFDEVVVDGAVRLTGAAVSALGRANTRLQNGQVQTYGLVAIIAAVILVLAIAGRRFW
jgi:NADH-quinone oxidoreductase subunit L